MSPDATGTRATERLHGGEDGQVLVLAIRELDGLSDVGGITGNGGVLLGLGRVVHHDFLRLFDRGKDPGLAVFVTVGADAYPYVDFVGVGACLEVFGNSKDGVGRSQRWWAGDVGVRSFSMIFTYVGVRIGCGVACCMLHVAYGMWRDG